MKICAVIPAAGRGTRLGLDVPKILAPIGDQTSVWTILQSKLATIVDHIHVVLSPDGAPAFSDALARAPARQDISTSIQASPIGMGDAIFSASPFWREAERLVVIWGDQIHVSSPSLYGALALHAGQPTTVGLPVVRLAEPYVEYRFDETGRLTSILQTREGDRCAPNGFGDIGTFVLSVTGLEAMWRAYMSIGKHGTLTGEVNFLPFLLFLSDNGWNIERYMISDPDEARGINTPADLDYFRRLYGKRRFA